MATKAPAQASLEAPPHTDDEAPAASTAIATGVAAPLATREQPLGVSGEPDPSDYTTPYLRLVQGSSASARDNKPGSFVYTNGSSVQTIEFIVVHIALVRTFYNEETKELACSSRDRRTGIARRIEWVDPSREEAGRASLACNQCPHYRDKFKGGCSMGYVLTCVDFETDQPFLYSVKGGSIGLFRNKIVNDALRGTAPPWSTVWKMAGVFKSANSNNWWEVELTPQMRIEPADQAAWASYASQFLTDEGAAQGDDHAAADPDDLPFE